MTFSGLASQTHDTSQKSSRQGAKIDMVICHHAATTNAAQVLSAELTGSRQVSSNYIITNTGDIWGVVPEEYRAWTSGSSSDGGKGAAFDRRAITFECADESNGGSWPISAASQAAIVKLLVDVHQRYGIPLDRDHIVGHRELYTRWGASYATACPGGMNVDDLVNRARAAVGAKPIPTQGSGSSAASPDPEGGIVGVSRTVKQVQQFLIGKGISVGSTGADGIYGPATKAGVVAYQKANGLDPDGIWGPLTDAKAFGTTPTQHAPAPTPSAPKFPLPSGYYYGPRSGPVQSVSGYVAPYGGPNGAAGLKTWQQRMKDRGNSITVDGLYGPETQRIATNFQKQCGIKADGLIGPDTWGKAWTAAVTGQKL